MPYKIFITPAAVADIEAAIAYYNEKATDLGYRFSALVEEYLAFIAAVPTAAAIKYKNIRCKPMATFPYLILFTLEEKNSTISILRIFNSYQKPLW